MNQALNAVQMIVNEDPADAVADKMFLKKCLKTLLIKQIQIMLVQLKTKRQRIQPLLKKKLHPRVASALLLQKQKIRLKLIALKLILLIKQQPTQPVLKQALKRIL